MQGQTNVLQQRVEITAIDRRWVEPLKWVRCGENEQQKAKGDHRLHGQGPRLKGWWQVAAEQCHHSAEKREDQDPQDHRPFVVPPGR